MDHETTTLFCRPLMGPDEYILWQGQPDKKGRVLFGTDLAQLIFAIVWTVMACGFCVPAFLFGLDPSAYFIILFPVCQQKNPRNKILLHESDVILSERERVEESAH